MNPEELKEAMATVSQLIHRIYNDTNEGPRLLNELFREYPEARALRNKEGRLTDIPATAVIY